MLEGRISRAVRQAVPLGVAAGGRDGSVDDLGGVETEPGLGRENHCGQLSGLRHYSRYFLSCLGVRLTFKSETEYTD